MGEEFKSGFVTLIGRTNVGKSTLLNLLVGEKVAAIANKVQTTRTAIKGIVNRQNSQIIFVDTPGIHKPKTKLNETMVETSFTSLTDSDIVLFLIEATSEDIGRGDRIILDKLKESKRKTILIINKIDLESKIDYNILKDEKIIKMSILNNNGLNELKEEIRNMYGFDKIEQGDYTYISNVSDVATLNNCLDKINDIKTGILNNYPIDIVEIDIKALWDMLGTITGDTYKDELIDALFSKFCLGK